MPTIKQKTAYKEVVKGSTIVSAMKVAGYSEKTSKRTNKLTNTKGFKELIDKHLSDSKLAKVHDEGLKATKLHNVGNKTIETEDYATRHKYLETGYKIKGQLAPQEQTTNIQQNIAFFIKQQEKPNYIETENITDS